MDFNNPALIEAVAKELTRLYSDTDPQATWPSSQVEAMSVIAIVAGFYNAAQGEFVG